MDILIRGLEPGADYILQARAKSSAGQTSQWSTTFKLHTTSDVTAPSPITSLSWQPNRTAFVATWSRPTTDSNGLPLKDFRSYEVTLTAASISKKYVVFQERFDLSFEQNVALFGTPQSTVQISVKVSDVVGNLSTAVTASASNPIPADVTGFSAEGILNAIALAWDVSAEDDFKQYELYMSLVGSGFTPGPTNLIAKTTTPSFLLPTTNSTMHYFKVRQIDVFGQGSAGYASASAEPILTTGLDTTPPAAPSNVEVTTASGIDGSSSVTVTWDAVTSTNLGEYVVRYSTDEVNWRYVAVPSDQELAVLDNLLPGTGYYVAVASVSQVSSYSAFVNAADYPITTAADTTAPSKPSAPTVSISSGTANAAQVSHDLTKNAGGVLEADTVMLEVHASTTTTFTPDATTLRGTIQVASVGVSVSGVFYYPVTTSVSNLYWKVIAVDRAGNKSTPSNQTTGIPGLILTANIADAQITNAKINDLEASKITAGTGIINDLLIKSSLTINGASGFIKSNNYDATAQTGWRLDQNGLVIYNGTISAAALLLQDSANIAPPVFADFEFNSSYYHDASNVPNSGQLTATSGMLLASVTSGQKVGIQALRVYNTSITSPTKHSLYFATGGASTTGVNVNVDPGTYIVSIWAKKNGTPNQDITLNVYTDAGAAVSSSSIAVTSTSMTRYSAPLVIPSGISKLKIYMTVGPQAANTGYDLLIDALQFERQVGGSSTPSPWRSPSSTTIDGGSIITGSIRSSANAVGVTAQPAWSLNTQGNIQVGDALVRGTLTVGAGADTTNSIVQSANYVANSSGWIIRGDGTAEFNSTTVRGTLTVTGANGKIQTALLSNYPTIFFYNANSSNWAFMNLVDGTGSQASLGINNGKYTSVVDGTTQLRSRLWMVGPNSVTRLGHVTDPAQQVVGGQFGFTETAAYVSSATLSSVERGLLTIANDGTVTLTSSTSAATKAATYYSNSVGDVYINTFSTVSPYNAVTQFLSTKDGSNLGSIWLSVMNGSNNHLRNQFSVTDSYSMLESFLADGTTQAAYIQMQDGLIYMRGRDTVLSVDGPQLTIGGVNGYLRVYNEPWIDVTYTNLWVTRPTFKHLQYKKFPDGTVRLRGTCTPGSANTSPATLPVGYRPSTVVSFACPHDNVTAGQMARINIGTDGVITPFGMAGAGSTFGFDGISFAITDT